MNTDSRKESVSNESDVDRSVRPHEGVVDDQGLSVQSCHVTDREQLNHHHHTHNNTYHTIAAAASRDSGVAFVSNLSVSSHAQGEQGRDGGGVGTPRRDPSQAVDHGGTGDTSGRTSCRTRSTSFRSGQVPNTTAQGGGPPERGVQEEEHSSGVCAAASAAAHQRERNDPPAPEVRAHEDTRSPKHQPRTLWASAVMPA